MTAYHAIHESPYDDACPDCTGFALADLVRRDRNKPTGAALVWALFAIGVFVALFVVGAWMYVKGGTPQ